MIKLENTEVIGWEAAIRGMRNPMNSWANSDSGVCTPAQCWNCSITEEECHMRQNSDNYCPEFSVGINDYNLMLNLSKGGPVHAKYRRMITVYVDITAPLYWWKEFDTYKVGTVANSCSTMHKIHAKEFMLDDFSHDRLLGRCDKLLIDVPELQSYEIPLLVLENTIKCLNFYREMYLETKDKTYWWQMIQLLPSSYMQKRTIMMNYETCSHIYHDRKNHPMGDGHWNNVIEWIESLPYSEIITTTNISD